MMRKDSLQTRVTTYHDAYKWREFGHASNYVAEPKDFLEQMKKTQARVEITEYDILNVQFNPEGTEAIISVRRTYIISPSITVHTQQLEQKWKYDHEKKNWFLVSPY